MKTTQHVMMITACAWLLATASAQAFYNAQAGRWLNRDPIAESGGANVHGFEANAPIQNLDPLGLAIYSGDPEFWRCKKADCNGVQYYWSTHCCCHGRVVSQTPVPTGIQKHHWRGTPLPNGLVPVHDWITWEGGSADASASSALVPGGANGEFSSPAGFTPALYETVEVTLSPCSYDFAKLSACLSRKAAEFRALQAAGRFKMLCWDLPGRMLSDCLPESTGCTVPP